jgi:hypothetical protein
VSEPLVRSIFACGDGTLFVAKTDQIRDAIAGHDILGALQQRRVWPLRARITVMPSLLKLAVPLSIFATFGVTSSESETLKCTQANNAFAALTVTNGAPDPWMLEFDMEKGQLIGLTQSNSGSLTQIDPVPLDVSDTTIRWKLPGAKVQSFRLDRDSLELSLVGNGAEFILYNCELFRRQL